MGIVASNQNGGSANIVSLVKHMSLNNVSGFVNCGEFCKCGTFHLHMTVTKDEE
jgi:hypothetical protein